MFEVAIQRHRQKIVARETLQCDPQKLLANVRWWYFPETEIVGEAKEGKKRMRQVEGRDSAGSFMAVVKID